MDSIPQPAQPNSYLRLIRDEDAPSYDAGFESVTPQSTGGFSMIPTTVFEKLSGDGFALAVYAVLVKHVNKEGLCWPATSKICAMLGWSRKLVEPAIQRLISAGLVVKEHRQLNGMKRSNLYMLPAYVQIVPTEPTIVPTAPPDSSHRTIGTFPRNDRTISIELDTKELGVNDPPPPKTATKKSNEYSTEFAAFWAGYQHEGRSSKPDSFRLWSALSVEDRAAAAESLPLFKAGRDWQTGFAPGCQVWLKQRRWEAPPHPASVNGRSAPKGPTQNGRVGYSLDELMTLSKGEALEQNRDDETAHDASFRVVR